MGIQSFPQSFHLGCFRKEFPIQSRLPVGLTCGFRWALFGKALPKKFAGKTWRNTFGFCGGVSRMSRKTWKCEDVSKLCSRFIWKKNSWAANPGALQGVERSLFSFSSFQNDTQFPPPEIWGDLCPFWGELLPKSCSLISLQTKNFTAQESLDTQWESQHTRASSGKCWVFSDIHLYKQPFLERLRLVVPLLLLSLQNNHPPEKQSSKSEARIILEWKWVLWSDGKCLISPPVLPHIYSCILWRILYLYILCTFNCQYQPVIPLPVIWDINGKSSSFLANTFSKWSSIASSHPQSQLCCLRLHSSICGCNNGRLQPVGQITGTRCFHQFLNKTLPGHPRKFFTNALHFCWLIVC